MKKALGFCVLFVLIITVLTACSQTPGYKKYKVGEIGPAGGYVFYDKGKYTDGWRYLEAAPADIRLVNGVPTVDSSVSGYSEADGYFIFGYYRNSDDGNNLFVNGTTHYFSSNCTGTNVGTGKNNTQMLVSAMKNETYMLESGSSKTDEYAARLCDVLTYSFNGEEFDDWFLPSSDELNCIYTNLHKAGIGNFDNDCFYWSSSENANDVCYANGRHFSNGHQSFDQRDYIRRVRAVRAF